MVATTAKKVVAAAPLPTLVPDSIHLIIPPAAFLLDERVFPYLGIQRIAAVLRNAGAGVALIDLSGVKNFLQVVEDYVRHENASLIGITATTPQMPAVAQIISAIRRVNPRAKIILGGPHPTLANAAAKRERFHNARFHRACDHMEELHRLADIIVAGDGEQAVFAACHPQAPRLVDADDPKSVFWLTNDKLEELPWPARDLVDMKSYHYKIGDHPATSLIAQLGCPFECTFCGGRESAMLRRIRTRSTENIVAEIEHIYREYGITGFMFYDDELNVNKFMLPLMRAIAQKQRELNVEWALRGFIKAELFNEEQAAAMYDAGFRWILVGFESGSPRILKNINKKATAEENSRCIQIAHQHGLKVKALMSVGHAGETRETIEETRRWLMAEEPDDFDVSLITCYPGTPYYDQAVPVDENDPNGLWVYTVPTRRGGSGDKLFMDAFDPLGHAYYYKGDPDDPDGYRSYVLTPDLSREDLVRLRGDLESGVRAALNIPFNPGAPGINYEASMGMPGPNILRTHIPQKKT